MKYLFFLFLISVALLFGCVELPRPEGKPLPVQTFQHFKPIFLDVEKVEVIDRSRRLERSTSFELLLVSALNSYGGSRFLSAGSKDTFWLRFNKIEVNKKTRHQKNKILKITGLGREEEYTALVEIEITISSSNQNEVGRQYRFKRSLVLPEGISLVEKERRQIKFLEIFVQDIDQKVIEVIDQDLRIEVLND